jgi:hypothetical protein
LLLAALAGLSKSLVLLKNIWPVVEFILNLVSSAPPTIECVKLPAPSGSVGVTSAAAIAVDVFSF